MNFLPSLPYPDVVEKLDYYKIKEELIKLFSEKVQGYELLESDPYSSVIEAIAYREMLLRARINDSVLSMLIPYATKSDLDNIAALYGVERSKGDKPKADVKFTLTTTLDKDITISRNILFHSNKGDVALLENDVIIKAGEESASGVLILDAYVKESSVKTEYIQNPPPFIFKVEQTTNYTKGADVESDEAFRERAILSLDRFSTAGSERAYKYYALLASTKVEEAAVLKDHPAGVVRVRLKISDEDASVINSVESILNKEKVRPLTDTVEVRMADKIIIARVKADIELLDLSRLDEIKAKIEAVRKNRFALGEDVNLSYLYKTLHQDGVYRVTITEPTKNTIVVDHEFVEIGEWDLNYKEAIW